MPRCQRKKCESGIYHIMIRGIDRQDIFHDEEDYLRFLETLDKVKEGNNYELFSYCLMSNHAHLLLQEKDDDISKTMKRIGVSYAWWYNWKYNRVGHVFQDRFRSETITDDVQLLNVVRYIHNNPVKASMLLQGEGYRWSSCRVYYGQKEYPERLTNYDFVLSILSDNKEMAVNKLREFTKLENEDKFLDYEAKSRKSDAEIKKSIEEILGGKPVSFLKTMEKKERREILKRIKGIDGATQRQIARLTGINQSIISQA